MLQSFMKTGAFLSRHKRKVGVAAIGLALTTPMAEKFRRTVVGHFHPNVEFPAGTGRFGFDTSGSNQPASIEGLKFNFRRR